MNPLINLKQKLLLKDLRLGVLFLLTVDYRPAAHAFSDVNQLLQHPNSTQHAGSNVVRLFVTGRGFGSKNRMSLNFPSC